MRKIGIKELDDIATGAGILGAGGGGDPYIGKLMAIQAIQEFGEPTLISVDDLEDDDLVLPIAMMGAPTVLAEKAMNGNEYDELFKQMERFLGKKVRAVMPIEAGGVNSMIPFIAACRNKLPIVDADAMGRAFPELQMVTFTIGDIPATPMCLTDEKGNSCILNTISNKWTENIARSITMTVGASVSMILYPVTGKQIKEFGIRDIVTKSEIIGKTIKDLKKSNSNNKIEEFLKVVGGYKLFAGKVSDINRITRDAFNFGETKIDGIDEYKGKMCEVSFQNENLCVKVGDKILATTPDLITLIDIETLNPITTDMIKYGKRVLVIAMPCDKLWRTKKGLEIAGPKYFKLDCEYVSVEELAGEKNV